MFAQLDGALHGAVERAFDDAAAGPAVRPRLVHGDLGAEHVITDPATGRPVGLIDFEDASVGDPAVDLAGLLASLGEDEAHRIAAAHGGPADWQRVRLHWRFAPLYDVLHASRQQDEALLRDALADLRSRFGLPPAAPMPHSYTNHTLGTPDTVDKHCRGADAAARAERERTALRALAGGPVPVPPLRGAGGTGATVRTRRIDGIPGQELIARGRAAAVLRACGTALARIHALRAADILGPDAGSGALVHGDYGPNNTLLDADARRVTAVVDWEFAHAGDPVEDLAWCEWIVRMHHPGDAGALPQLWSAYTAAGGGPVPAWPARRAEMLRRCRDLRAWCRRWPGGNLGGAARWTERLAATEGWTGE